MDKGYHVLRFIGLISKVISLLCVLFACSIVGLTLWASSEALTVIGRYGFTGVPTLIFFNIFIFLFFGGFPALFFWVLASLIDLLVNINFKVDVLASYLVTQQRSSIPSQPAPKPLNDAEEYLARIRAKTR